MTIEQVIDRVNQLKPNAIDDERKLEWLVTFDGQIYQEVTSADDADTMPAEGMQDTLLVGAPYQEIYDHYLIGKIEYTMREYSAYNNTQAMLMQEYNQFRSWWRRNHKPAAVYVKNLYDKGGRGNWGPLNMDETGE